MADFVFASLTDGAVLGFDPAADRLLFDAPLSARQLLLEDTAGGLRLTLDGKSVTLGGVSAEDIPSAALAFADGSVVHLGDGALGRLADWLADDLLIAASGAGHYVDARGGADNVTTGAGDDWIIGNRALDAPTLISQTAGTPSPTAATQPQIAADGQSLVFLGGWTGFGSASNGAADVILGDGITGQNIHLDASGDPVAATAARASLTADGAFAGFDSDADLGAGLVGRQVWRVAVAGGAAALVSADALGVAANADATGLGLSADGRYGVFTSAATNLGPADGSGAETDIFRKDMTTGAVVRVSTAMLGGDGDADSDGAAISADGRYVVFSSAASNLATLASGSGARDIYLWDGQDNRLVNITAGVGETMDADSARIAVTGDGAGVVLFRTDRQILGADQNGTSDIYAWNMQTGLFTLVSAGAAGVANGASDGVAVSGDGRFVVFRSAASNLVAGDTNGLADVFVKDLMTGAIALVSAPAGGQANGAALGGVSISHGGDWISFDSAATNLGPGDGNGAGADVFRLANPLLLDRLAGGAGNDTYVLSRADQVIEAANEGHDTIRAAFSITLPENVEVLWLTGSGNINATGNGGDNILISNGGNNVLDGGLGRDRASYLAAAQGVFVSLALTGVQATGAGYDQLIGVEDLSGSTHADQLTGDGLANWLDGGAGADTLIGGAGNDTLVVDQAGDVLIEAPGASRDTVVAGLDWTLAVNLENLTLIGAAVNGTGNAAANLLTGNANANLLRGGDGNDTLSGWAGSDTLHGGRGNDLFIADTAGDSLIEAANAGRDTVRTALDWTLAPNFENLWLTVTATNGTGNALANTITGNPAANRLRGLDGNDRLTAGAGNDTLNGGLGADVQTGGAGADRFVWTKYAESRTGPANRDRITDFTPGEDLLDFRFVDASIRHIGRQDLRWSGSLPQANSVWQAFDGNRIMLNIDVNGDRRADMQVALDGVTLVSGADFLF